MQMMMSACLTASTKKHPKILAEDVTYAIKQQQLLAQVYLNKDVSKNVSPWPSNLLIALTASLFMG
jgi:hypothetical protein